MTCRNGDGDGKEDPDRHQTRQYRETDRVHQEVDRQLFSWEGTTSFPRGSLQPRFSPRVKKPSSVHPGPGAPKPPVRPQTHRDGASEGDDFRIDAELRQASLDFRRGTRDSRRGRYQDARTISLSGATILCPPPATNMPCFLGLMSTTSSTRPPMSNVLRNVIPFDPAPHTAISFPQRPHLARRPSHRLDILAVSRNERLESPPVPRAFRRPLVDARPHPDRLAPPPETRRTDTARKRPRRPSPRGTRHSRARSTATAP